MDLLSRIQPSHIAITAGCLAALAAESLISLVLCTSYYYYDFVACLSAAAINELGYLTCMCRQAHAVT